MLTFKTWEEADAYMDAGKHAGVSDGESMYDAARKNAKLYMATKSKVNIVQLILWVRSLATPMP